MTKYNVTLEYGAGGHNGPVSVDAQSIKANADWIIFHSDNQGASHSVLAAFPRDRVVSVVVVTDS